MNILITGASGFIGKNLSKELEKQHNVFYLLRPHNKSQKPGVCGNTFYLTDDSANYLSNFIEDSKIDGIIHLASLYIQSHTEDQIRDLILSNVYLGTFVLNSAVKTNVKWFLNTGTIWQNYNVPDKSDKYCPVNLYAATKQAFIDIAKFYTETSNIDFVTLKLCDTYGPGDTRRKIFALFEQIAKSGEVLEMSPGEQKMDIIHIDDVVNGFIKLVEMLENKECTKSEYVLSSGNQYTLKELASLYEQKYKVKLNIKWGEKPYRTREVMKPYVGNILPNWSPLNKL